MARLLSNWRSPDGVTNERVREMRAPRHRIMGQIRDAIEKRMEQEAFEKWMEEHGDEGLWPAYRRSVSRRRGSTGSSPFWTASSKRVLILTE